MALTQVTSAGLKDGEIVNADLHSAASVALSKLASTGALGSAVTATTQSASDDSTKLATTAFVQAAVTSLIDGAPGSLNTLNELAAAINDDSSYATTLTTALATKLPLAGGTLTGTLNVDGGSSGMIDFGDTGSAFGRLYADSTGTFIGSKTQHYLWLRTNNVQRIKVSDTSAATSIGGAFAFNAMLTTQGDISGGLLMLKASENTNRFFVSGNDTSGCEVNLYDDSGGQRGIVGVSSNEFFLKAPNNSAPLTFYTHNGSSIGERFRIASDGKVYFGDFASVGSKAYILKEVSGDYKFNIFASSSTTTNRIITINSRSDVEAMRIDADGRLLYGTTSSTRETSLVLVGNSNSHTTNPGVIDLFVGNTPSNLGSMGQICFGTQNVVGARIDGRADQDWTLGSARGTHIRFLTVENGSTSLTERLRIHSTGQVEFKVPDSVATLKLTPSGTNAPATIDFNTPGVGSAVFKVQGTEKLRITSGGQIKHSLGHSSGSSANEDTSWYGDDANEYTLEHRDFNEIYALKTVNANNYASYVYRRETMTSWCDIEFELMGGTPSGYRHVGFAINGDGSDTNGNFDRLVFRSHASNSSLNQVRLDTSSGEGFGTVGTGVPQWFDGTWRHILLQIRGDEYGITVDGVRKFSFNSSYAAARASGYFGFTIYEASNDNNPWLKLKNFKIRNYSKEWASPQLSSAGNNDAIQVMHDTNNKWGKMIGKRIHNTSSASSKNVDILNIDSWQSPNSRIIVKVNVMAISPVAEIGFFAYGSAYCRRGGSNTTAQSHSVNTMTLENRFGNSSAYGSLDWNGMVLRYQTPDVAYLDMHVDVEYHGYDGVNVTFPTKYIVAS